MNRHNPESHWRTEAGKHRRDDNLLPPVIYATGYHPSPVPNAALQLSVAESSHDAAKQPTQARFYTDRAASLQYLPVYAPVAASTMSFGRRVLEQTPSLTSGCSRGTAAAAAAAASSREALSSLLAHSTYTTTRRHDDTTTTYTTIHSFTRPTLESHKPHLPTTTPTACDRSVHWEGEPGLGGHPAKPRVMRLKLVSQPRPVQPSFPPWALIDTSDVRDGDGGWRGNGWTGTTLSL
ncbi:hypothetical protein CABS01_05847 [Colletotrichum abscissum]|uniref:Uncharacterized protein n=1 Tax=Colletotrichum abscissum TaxID=1671311 RepID=A0A9P9X9R0_9PEZI|nr:uncharacterized protein CABS01_05847 [Colletotrichum abscissum]KAI3543993.1 hypothetical protein CABS02_12371 [Colletotrichum abscissum]KAK1518313.1 hypothetical protein CABS01_05847 [Colletotrichum abscissum]